MTGEWTHRRKTVSFGRSAFAGLLFALAAFSSGTALGQTLSANNGESAATIRFAIPPQALASALVTFGEATNLQVLYNADVAKGVRTAGVQGAFPKTQALTRLLAGTGLIYRFTNANTVTVEPPGGATTAATNVPGAISLDTINVQGGSSTSDPYAGMLNPPTTIGSKTPETLREIPQTVDVVTQEQIKQQNFQTLDQALKYAPGISINQSDNDRVQYYARGFPIASMQIDGLPVVMNPNLSQTSSTNAPSLAMFDRVEVLDGPAGLYNGFGSAGGTINLVRKRAPYQFTASTELGIGTYDNKLGTVDIGGPLNSAGTIRGRFVADLQSQDLTANSTWQRDQNFYGTVEADLTPSTLLRTGASYGRRDNNATWGGSPIFTDYSVAGPRSQFFGAPWDHDTYETTDAFVSLEQKFDNGWLAKAAGDYTYNKNQILQATIAGVNDAGTVDPATNIGDIGSNNKSGHESNKSFDVYASGPILLFEREHRLTFGVNYSSMNEFQQTIYDSTGGGHFDQIVNIYNYSYTEPTFAVNPSTTLKNKTNTDQLGIYGSAKIKLLDQLTLVVGGRVNWWNTEFLPDATYNWANLSASHAKYDARVTPYGGLVYDIDKTYSAYVSYATIFQPQDAYDKTGQILKPMTGDQYEGGVKAAYFDGKLIASVALFQLTQENRAESDPTDPTGSYSIAAGKARTRGVDVRVSGQVLPGLDVFAGYTYNNSKYLDNSTDDSAVDFSQIAPTHLFKIWANYRLPGPYNKWQVGAGVNATSELYAYDGIGRVVQPGYFTADARIAYQITDKVSLNLNATNLFDKYYYQPGTPYNGAIWGAPRKVLLTLRGTL